MLQVDERGMQDKISVNPRMNDGVFLLTIENKLELKNLFLFGFGFGAVCI
jgi:hypothetical protein